MIPSAPSPTGDHLAAWQSGDSWVDHSSGAAAAYHSSSLNSSSGPTATAAASAAANSSSRYLTHHRHQILDWENAMLLAAQHSDMPSSEATNNAQGSVYDHVASEYSKATTISPIQADHLHAYSHARLYDNLLSPHVTPSANSGSFANSNAWALLNTVCSRTVSAGTLQQEPCFLQQAASAQFNGYDTLDGADGLGDLGSLGAAAATSLYADSLRSGGATGCVGLTSFDQRRLDDIMKRELYTTHADFSTSRLGLNLGGRTYFPADDFAFGRWGKRLKHNSPGCMLQPAPLCQAEGCKADLSMAKHYHRRHKVCEYHSKAATVHIGNQTQRFCQQCSRFHVLDEFDDGKRSCRKRLADHNRRRRKPQPTPMSSATTSAGALAAETASNTTEAQGQRGDGNQNGNASVATEQETCKEPTNSQEAATGGSDSSNEASGATSGKGSPTLEAEDHPKPASISIPPGSLSASQKELNSGSILGNEQNKFSKHDQSNDQTVLSRSSFTLSCSGHGIDMAIVSPEKSHIAANLSLGGAADILDVKPAHPLIQASVVDACSLASSRHSVVMPWLQPSNKKQHHSMKGRPYEEQRRSDAAANEAADEHGQYSSFKTVPSPGYNDSNGTRGSWMNMKGVAGLTGADSSTDDVLLSPRYTDGFKPGDSEAGGHEVLRLLSDERKLLTADKNGPLQGNLGSGIGTLAFLDQTLVQSGFARSDQHPRVLQFSNLQDTNADRQASTSLRHGPPANVAFDGHSHGHSHII